MNPGKGKAPNARTFGAQDANCSESKLAVISLDHSVDMQQLFQ